MLNINTLLFQTSMHDRYRIPGVVGIIDCTHILINSPGSDNAENYRNRKGYFSLNVYKVIKLMFCSFIYYVKVTSKEIIIKSM